MSEEELLQGKHFSITDPKDVNTVIYRINETEKEFLKDFIELKNPEVDRLVEQG